MVVLTLAGELRSWSTQERPFIAGIQSREAPLVFTALPNGSLILARPKASSNPFSHLMNPGQENGYV